ncbi:MULTISPECIES: CarD family transcriptional regulator [unclassified Bacillus (in: firmicutes)]|uniref:CarD family transcriptional regulator n=1 Tax=unclassified Bacillus (in: firmicutes) TaxID=185979 RepID=UPI0008ED8258|nr:MULTISPECIES: CarD family transcriptional regulator [unclassified Bacillus (in: firmicutes)]SFI37329.1 transcriptional regulator, CarD family [Bacillus sp. 71mf]SFT11485.1 transcriptional regulator, CarD family [Bacillus sp. 103mf]
MEVDYLFQIGDKIVYPMHGAGVIEGIEEKEILGEKQKYYVIRIPISNMEVMIPMKKMIQSRIRLIADMLTLENVLLIFQYGESDNSLSWKQRYTQNMEKMKRGEIQEGAEVVRDLIRRNKVRALNTSEKQMLDNAQKILISELSLIKGITENQAIDLLNTKVG